MSDALQVANALMGDLDHELFDDALIAGTRDNTPNIASFWIVLSDETGYKITVEKE